MRLDADVVIAVVYEVQRIVFGVGQVLGLREDVGVRTGSNYESLPFEGVKGAGFKQLKLVRVIDFASGLGQIHALIRENVGEMANNRLI